MALCVSKPADGGNVQLVRASDPSDIEIRIEKDNGAGFLQWFYFRLVGAKDQECQIRVSNAHEAAYSKAFVDYRAVASYDRQRWFRVPTQFDGQVLTIEHRPQADSVWYAYFAPFSMERHADLVARCQCDDRVRLEMLGSTLDGQDIDYLRVGRPERHKKNCWLIARQHPGETMAEWWMEGFLDRLLDPDDSVSLALLDRAVFHIVPNMNPDGSRRGHLRTNAIGTNLNRAWSEPSMTSSPEVFLVRQKMEETGVDFLLDVHGDEELPYNFIAGFEGIPSVTERQLELLDRFKQQLVSISSDFQLEHGYPPAPAGQGNLKMATNWVAERFGCLAMTLEQPFKDAANNPQPDEGWSPRRCARLAWDCLETLASMVDELR